MFLIVIFINIYFEMLIKSGGVGLTNTNMNNIINVVSKEVANKLIRRDLWQEL